MIVKSGMTSCWHRLSKCVYRVCKMAREEVMKNLSLLISIFIFETKSIDFEITRPKVNIKSDLFTNERALNTGNCRSQHNGSVKQFCSTKNASCLAWNQCRVCECRYDYSTFYMYSKFPLRYECVGNKEIRRLAGCDIAGFYQITNNQPLLVVDLEKDGSKGLLYSKNTVPLFLKSLGINGNAAIRDGGKWREVENSNTVFSMEKQTEYPFYELKWTDGLGSLYQGRLMRVNLTWTMTTNQVVHVCVVFRVAGTLIYNLDVPSSPCPNGNVSSLSSTTTAPRTRSSTIKETRKLSTIKRKSEVTKQTPSVGPSNSLRPSEVSSSLSSPDLPTEKGRTTSTESKKNRRSSSINSDKVLITIISAVAAVICVLIVSLFAWLIVRQRKRNRRGDEPSGAKVISNPAGSPVQNNIQLPVIKNPLYDEHEPIYCDANDNQDRSLPRRSRKNRFLSPTYVEANAGALVIKNTGTVAKAHSPQKNINVQKELHDRRESGPLYQGLSSHRPEDSTNQPLYESLNSADTGHCEFIYQPLITTKPVQSDGSAEYLQPGDVMPDYVTLINPDEEKYWDNRKQGNMRSPQDSDIPAYAAALENLPLPNKITSPGVDDEPDYDELEDPYATSSTSPTSTQTL